MRINVTAAGTIPLYDYARRMTFIFAGWHRWFVGDANNNMGMK